MWFDLTILPLIFCLERKGDTMYIQVIVIDSDLDSAKQLKYALQNNLVKAYYTTSVTEGLKYLARFHYQLVIMDVSLGDCDGFQSLKKVRQFTAVPILAISRNNDSSHIVQILAVADDYLQKPYDMEVCHAHIAALVRRFAYGSQQDAPGVLSKDGSLMIDARCRRVYVLEKEIVLPRKPFALLYLMACHEEQVFTHEQLYRNIWGEDYMSYSNAPLNCQVRKLRRQLESVPGAPHYIHTIRGIGYRFDSDAH